MKLKWACTLVGVTGVVTACSFGPIRASSTAAPTTGISQLARDGATLSPGSIGSAGPVVGVNLYALHNYSPREAVTYGTRTLGYIRNDLHADAVDLVWNLYTPSYTSDLVVTKNAETLTASDIGTLTRIAQRDGLLVEYRPIMFVETRENPWEGLIEPASPDAWFDSYYQANLPYLEMAQRYRVNEYVIGTEMNLIGSDPQWASFLSRSAKVFTGQITYAASDNLYFPPSTQLPPTALTGMDMYERLRLPASASLSEVVAAYDKFFAGAPAPLLERTAIQETGIEARAGAYRQTPNLGMPGILDEAVQYDWFMAGCEAVGRFHLRGIFFWKVDLADNPVHHPASSLSTFEGKSGATAISKCASIIKD